MTKDLSRQLAECAGIEVKYAVAVGGMQKPYCKWFRTGKPYFSNKQEAQEYIDSIKLRGLKYKSATIVELKVDFEQPENFCKLLECLYKNSIQVSFINRYGQVQVGIGVGNSLIEACIDFINILAKKDDLDSKNLLTELKQALQEQNWKY